MIQEKFLPKIFENPPQKSGGSTSTEDYELENQKFREELKKGYFLQLSENYVSRNKLSAERVARENWQNFYDANNFTLDGIEYEIKEEEEMSTIIIRGEAAYNFTRLLAFGVGEKEDPERSAGGEGEGTRVMALHMLRDLGFNKVIFGSQDWELEFYFDKPPEGKVPRDKQHLRYLYARLQDKERETGNYIHFTTHQKEVLKNFIEAKKLFRSSDNEDFKNPDIENDKAGFRMHFEKNGNFYLNGQRIAYKEKNQWETLTDFTFWSRHTPNFKGEKITVGREREVITQSELTNIYLPFLVDSLSEKELQDTLYLLEPFYPVEIHKQEGEKLLELVIKKLEEKNYQTTFDSSFLTSDITSEKGKILEYIGYKLCQPKLHSLGMKKASEIWGEITELNEVEPTPKEKEKIELVSNFMADFFQATGEIKEKFGISTSLLKKIKIFENKHPYLEGKYNENFVWLKRTTLKDKNIDKILAHYKHEWCHQFGSDNSAEFSYALTDLDVRWNQYLRENPLALKELNEKWKKIKVEKEKWNFIQTEDAYLNILKEEEPVHWKTKDSWEQLNKDWEMIISKSKNPLDLIIKKISGKADFETLRKIFEEARDLPLIKKFEKICEADLIKNEEIKEKKKQEMSQLSKKISELLVKIEEEEKPHRRYLERKYSKVKEKDLAYRLRDTEVVKLKKELKNLEARYEVLRQESNELIGKDDFFYYLIKLKNNDSLYEVRVDDLYEFTNIKIFSATSLRLIFEEFDSKNYPKEKLPEETEKLVDFLLINGRENEKSRQKGLKEILKEEFKRIFPLVKEDKQPEKLEFARVIYEKYQELKEKLRE